MRSQKKLHMFCVEAKSVQDFFAKLSESVTSGCNKVWISEERNGEVSFIVGHERVRMSAGALKKGGML